MPGIKVAGGKGGRGERGGEGGHDYKVVAGGSFLGVIEEFCSPNVVVVIEIYTCDKMSLNYIPSPPKKVDVKTSEI